MTCRLQSIAILAGSFTFASATIAQPNTASTKIVITPEHVISVSGKQVFPIALSVVPAPDAKAPNGKTAWQEFRDAGAIFVRTSPSRNEDDKSMDWSDEGIARQMAYMDAAARAGMKCIPILRELSAVREGDAATEKRLRTVIRTLKNHPGMGVWKGADEPQWSGQPISPLLRAYRIIREEDPHHPVWIAHAPRGTIDELRTYNAAFDIGGVDVYPIGYPPGSHLIDANENKDISAIGDYTQKMLRVVEGKKPIWFTLQIAWSGVELPGRTLRFPTFPQERFMTYQAIINGARGLVYFGGAIPSTLSEHDKPYGYNWTFWDRVLRPVIEEVGDKSPLAAALCAPDSKLHVKAASNAIELCVREVGNDVFVLACCRDRQKTAQIEFTGLPNDVGKGDVLYESPRTVTAKDGSFSDWFAPYDVHVYRFPRR